MNVDVLSCNNGLHHYEDTNESKLLLDVKDGRLFIRRHYFDDATEYLTLYPPGTWQSITVEQ